MAIYCYFCSLPACARIWACLDRVLGAFHAVSLHVCYEHALARPNIRLHVGRPSEIQGGSVRVAGEVASRVMVTAFDMEARQPEHMPFNLAQTSPPTTHPETTPKSILALP